MILYQTTKSKDVIISCGVNAPHGVGHPYEQWATTNFLTHTSKFTSLSIRTWVAEYPHGSKSHAESPYGFKVHAFEWAFSQGFVHVLWLDSVISLVKDPQPIFETIERDGFFCLADAEWISRTSRADLFSYHKLTPYQTRTWRAMQGSVIGFDATNDRLMAVYSEWKDQEQRGLFSKGDSPNHRWDEACLTCSLAKRGIPPTYFETSGHPHSLEKLWVTFK